MWDLSIYGEDELVLENETIILNEKSIQEYITDAHNIRACIAKRLKRAKNVRKRLKDQNDLEVMRMNQRIEKMVLCRERADQYIKRATYFLKVEATKRLCLEQGLDPFYFIVPGGGLLAHAMEEMDAFLANTNPFQEFDRGYE